MRAILHSLALILCTAAAQAEPLRVATDIAPVHGLVARVMDGAGTPDLILRPGASPHGYAMRPSEAAALQAAQVVIHAGGGLTPWLEDALSTLAADAVQIALIDTPGTTTHDIREWAKFAPHTHDHDHDAHDHDHDAHGHEGDHTDAHGADHADAHHDGHDHGAHDHAGDHADAHDDAHTHARAHTGRDPHAWLDPANARAWLGHIAQTLAQADPANAALYRANAAAGQAEIDAAMADITAQLAPLQDAGFIVFHDAYQYFEHRFGLQAIATISLADAAGPGPARLARVRDMVADRDLTCIFSEPQFNDGLVATVTGDALVKTATLDPMGQTIEVGPAFYPALLAGMADSFAKCLSPW